MNDELIKIETQLSNGSIEYHECYRWASMQMIFEEFLKFNHIKSVKFSREKAILFQKIKKENFMKKFFNYIYKIVGRKI